MKEHGGLLRCNEVREREFRFEFWCEIDIVGVAR